MPHAWHNTYYSDRYIKALNQQLDRRNLHCIQTLARAMMEENSIDNNTAGYDYIDDMTKSEDQKMPTMLASSTTQLSDDYLHMQLNASYHSNSAIRVNISHREQEGVQNQEISFAQGKRNKCLIAISLLIGVLLVMTFVAIALSMFSYRVHVSDSVSIHDLNTLSDQLSHLAYVTQENISQVLVQLSENHDKFISLQSQLTSLQTQLNCGPGQWHRVAYFDMSDPGEQCPPDWREYNTSGIRACGRQTGGCTSKTYTTNSQLYSKVCGRALGYQFGHTDVFYNRQVDIDSDYVDGLSITHGRPRTHIWTFAAGLSQNLIPGMEHFACPCLAAESGFTHQTPPQYVGDNYFCESGNPTNMAFQTRLYTSDPLWDGQLCEGQCCSNGTSPPWFSVELSNPTTNNIEVRICGTDTPDKEDIPIKLLELYIQ